MYLEEYGWSVLLNSTLYDINDLPDYTLSFQTRDLLDLTKHGNHVAWVSIYPKDKNLRLFQQVKYPNPAISAANFPMHLPTLIKQLIALFEAE